jgi:hypothetical protein
MVMMVVTSVSAPAQSGALIPGIFKARWNTNETALSP